MHLAGYILADSSDARTHKR